MTIFHSFLWLIAFHCVYIPHFFPHSFIYEHKLFLYLGHCEYCCSKQGDGYVFKLMFSFSSAKYPEVELLHHTVVLVLLLPIVIHWGGTSWLSHSQCARLLHPHLCQHLLFLVLFKFFFKAITYLAVLGLSGGMQHLQSLLKHTISSAAACELLVVACEI